MKTFTVVSVKDDSSVESRIVHIEATDANEAATKAEHPDFVVVAVFTGQQDPL